MRFAILFLATLGLTTQHDLLDQEAIAAEVRSQTTTWTAGHNHYFDGRTLDEIKGLMGTYLETPEEMKLPLKDITPLEDIPESFDPTQKWPGC